MALFTTRLINPWSRLWLLLLVVFVAPFAVQAQDDVVTTDVSLVQLNVGVVDRQGRAITSLSQRDFTVYEDGVKQPILHFEPTSAPFSLVLLLDMSGSTVTFRQQLKQSAWRFLDALGPEDRVAVIQFNAKPKILHGFSMDRKKAAYAIEIAEGAGQTYFYEALTFALRELSKEGKRRKAIVTLTDGIDTNLRNIDRVAVQNTESVEEAVKAANPNSSPVLASVLRAADRQGVTIYPLALPSGDPKRLPSNQPGAPLPPDPKIIGMYGAARMRLQHLADQTGGRLNEIHRLDQMARLYAEVAADLRSLYTVAYQPSSDRPRGKWHEIRIEVTEPSLIARTRPGYFGR